MFDDDDFRLLSSFSSGNPSKQQQQREEGEQAQMQLRNNESEQQREIRDFCKKIEQALFVTTMGFVGDAELAHALFMDDSIDSSKMARKFGFGSFEAFLRSDHMKGHVDIDDSRHHTTYHYPLAKAHLQNSKIHRQQEVPFLDMQTHRKISQRSRQRTECPNAEKLLLNRSRQRAGETVEKLPPSAPPGRGGYGVNRGFVGRDYNNFYSVSKEASYEDQKAGGSAAYRGNGTHRRQRGGSTMAGGTHRPGTSGNFAGIDNGGLYPFFRKVV